MRKLFIFVLFALLVSACSSTGAVTDSGPTGSAGVDQGRPAAQTKDYPIALTDQRSQSIFLMDPSVDNWNDPGAVIWTYKLPADMGRPNDVKRRIIDRFGGECMVITSPAHAAIVTLPGKEVKWTRNVGNVSPHSSELLPNGNIAIAAADGNWIRVYNSSQGPDAGTYAEYMLSSAHGVLWDPQMERLWVLGADKLAALKVAGTDAAPALEEDFSVPLPTQGGHDLSPVIGDKDRLWVSTNARVYQYVKSTGKFDSSFPGHALISVGGVKAIGTEPSGQVVWNKPKKGIYLGWNTDTVNLFSPNGLRTKEGTAFYKARIWNPNYQ